MMRINEMIGTILWRLGVPLNCSTSIADSLTYGYGRLDGNGFWQFPVYPDQIDRKRGKK